MFLVNETETETLVLTPGSTGGSRSEQAAPARRASPPEARQRGDGGVLRQDAAFSLHSLLVFSLFKAGFMPSVGPELATQRQMRPRPGQPGARLLPTVNHGKATHRWPHHEETYVPRARI